MSRPVVAPPKLHAAAERLGRVEAIDPPAKTVAKAVRDAVPNGPVKDALAGTWLGHALHPLLTDVVIGVGTGGPLPTAVTGAQDWADPEVADDSSRRVGAIHGVLNTAALGLF